MSLRHTPRPTALALALGLVLCGLWAPAAQASHVGEELTGDQQVVQTADQLFAALRQYQNMPAATRAQLEARLVQLAQQRQQRLIALLERNPRLAAMRFMPPGLRAGFPAAAQAYIERDLSATGTVAARVADDFARGQSRSDFVLQAAGTTYTLAMADPAGGERDLLGWTGRQVELRGVALGLRLVVTDRRQGRIVGLDTTGGTAVPNGTNSTPTITPVVKGDQRTLVILANFTDKALTCTAADVNTRVFGATGNTVNNGFKEASRGLVSFSGNVVGPYTIPYSAADTTCPFGNWGSAAESAARAAGVDPSQYTRVAYVVPPGGGCGWAGLAYMPGRQSWVNTCSSTGVYTHELGHNLALHHAATPTSEYGDGSDPMGGARVVRNNAGNQAMAGWLPTGSVLDVFAGGSYPLAALGGEAGTATQVLRIVKPDTSEVYYVSFRQALGVDANLPATFQNTVSVHRAIGTGKLPARTYLLQTLGAGGSFVDSINGIQIVNQGVAGNTATVGVSFSGGTCERVAPTVAVNPASASGSAGGAVSYGVTVTNNNTAACGTGSFALQQTLPSGFSGSFSATALSLAPGASASTTWQVRSASTAADATYTLDVIAGDGAGAATTSHASYIVATDRTAPTLTVTSPARDAVLSGRSVTLAATASDASGVAAVEFYVNGRLMARDASAPYSVNWNLRKAPKGLNTLRVRAVDNAGNATEDSFNVTVQ